MWPERATQTGMFYGACRENAAGTSLANVGDRHSLSASLRGHTDMIYSTFTLRSFLMKGLLGTALCAPLAVACDDDGDGDDDASAGEGGSKAGRGGSAGAGTSG
jgi:hypothetical protein